MPVRPLVWAPPFLGGVYPNMARRDAVVWERFLREYHPRPSLVCYNCALGGVVPNVPDAEEAQLLGWQWNTAAKVDVLADVDGALWLLEVKPSASYSAIGQVLSYLLLAQREQLDPRPLVPVILTDAVGPDMLYCVQQFGIRLLLFPEPAPSIEDTGIVPPTGVYEE